MRNLQSLALEYVRHVGVINGSPQMSSKIQAIK